MLKSIDTSKYLNNLVNNRCAEVFFHEKENFSIICTHCDLKTFEFGDFLVHFQNVHLLAGTISDSDVVADPWIKKEIVESPTVSQIFQEHKKQIYETKESVGVDVLGLASCFDANEFETAIDVDPGRGDHFMCQFDSKFEQDDDNGNSAYDGSDGDSVKEDEYIPTVFASKSPEVKSFECLQCKKSYKFAKNLETHMRAMHNDTKTVYKCPNCDVVLPNERALSKHQIKEHSGFGCTQCSKVYKSRNALKIHEYVHTGERRFKCDFENCNKAFFNPKHLCSHRRIVHTMERNFICEVCGYRTKHRSAFDVHKRSHTGEKPFICKICGKAFASQSLLCEHRPIHSSERPFKCEVCGSAFSRPKALYHHKHLHLGIKKYVCKICGKAYAQAAGLSGHMRQHKTDMLA